MTFILAWKSAYFYVMKIMEKKAQFSQRFVINSQQATFKFKSTDTTCWKDPSASGEMCESIP